MKFEFVPHSCCFYLYGLHPFGLLQKERRAKRVVSLVYDDSGSMRNNDRWKYANYALQSLVALLDEKINFLTFQ